MKDIGSSRRKSYYKFNSKYYKLLEENEDLLKALNDNFENAKDMSKKYYVEEGHDNENLSIYNNEQEYLRYCLIYLRKWKKANEEIKDVKEKLLKAEKKLI